MNDKIQELIKEKPQSGIREDIINWRLKLMLELFKELKLYGPDEGVLADKNIYIRLRGEDVRPISLQDSSPLCELEGIRSGYKDIKKLSDLSGGSLKAKELDKHVIATKKERRIQADLIKEALSNSRNLLKTKYFSCLKEYFSSLDFALDEVSFGDKNHKSSSGPDVVRADIIASGIRIIDGKRVPVVIELKYKRELTRLDEQLGNAAREIMESSDAFNPLLLGITGNEEMPFSEKDVEKIIVWPKPKSTESKKAKETRDENSIIFVEYEDLNEAEWKKTYSKGLPLKSLEAKFPESKS